MSTINPTPNRVMYADEWLEEQGLHAHGYKAYCPVVSGDGHDPETDGLHVEVGGVALVSYGWLGTWRSSLEAAQADVDEHDAAFHPVIETEPTEPLEDALDGEAPEEES